jgi:hypothetical protein
MPIIESAVHPFEVDYPGLKDQMSDLLVAVAIAHKYGCYAACERLLDQARETLASAKKGSTVIYLLEHDLKTLAAGDVPTWFQKWASSRLP